MFSNGVVPTMSATNGLLGGEAASPRIGGYGLLGWPQAQLQGYGQTGNLMQQYLLNLYMRRYQPPAIQQQPGMVGSQMGPGGMQYQAPQIANVPLPKPAGQSWASAYGPQYNQDGTWNFNSGFGSPG